MPRQNAAAHPADVRGRRLAYKVLRWIGGATGQDLAGTSRTVGFSTCRRVPKQANSRSSGKTRMI